MIPCDSTAIPRHETAPYNKTWYWSHSAAPTTAITFSREPREDRGCSLHVTIETDKLFLRSTQAAEEDYALYAGLFGDPKVMEYYTEGKTLSRGEVEDIIRGRLAKRWENNDPFSGFAVFEKETAEFVGHVVIGHGDHEGEAAVAGLMKEKFWSIKHYATEVATAILKKYAPLTILEGYTVEGAPVHTVTAIMRPENTRSVGLARHVGMEQTGEVVEHGNRRLAFSIGVKRLG